MENQEILVQEEPSYLDAAKDGNSSVWRYFAGTFSILFIWLILGGVATAFLMIIFAVIQGLSLTDITQLIFDPSLLGYIPYYLVLNLGFLFFIFGIFIGLRISKLFKKLSIKKI